MEHKYNGSFTSSQIEKTKKSLRGSIFFLLLCVDSKTASEYDENVDVVKCFENLLYRMGGLNELLKNPVEIVTAMSLLESALTEYKKEDFDFKVYRKLILDAGAEIAKIEEV